MKGSRSGHRIVRLAATLALSVASSACFLLEAPTDAEGPLACAADEVQVEGACQPAPCDPGFERDQATGLCVPDDALITETCEGHACGFVTRSGILCTEACGRWFRAEAPSPTLREQARQGGCFALDEATGRFVLFGGERLVSTNPPVNELRRDTWELDVSDPSTPTWIEVVSNTGANDENSPSARYAAACTSLPGGGVLLFGGSGISEEIGLAWLWREGAWHRLTLDASAAAAGLGVPRREPRLARGDVEGSALLIGGCVPGAVAGEGDVRSAALCRLTVAGGLLSATCADGLDPSAGLDYRFPAYPAVARLDDGRVMAFGGIINPSDRQPRSCTASWREAVSVALDETWAFAWPPDGVPRTELVATSYPGGREDGALVPLAGGRLLLFGGSHRHETEPSVDYEETCVFDGATWGCLTLEKTPTPRSLTHVGEKDGTVWLFGGYTGLSSYDDLWRYEPPQMP